MAISPQARPALAVTVFMVLVLHPDLTTAQSIAATAIDFPAHASSDLGRAGIQLSGVLYKPSSYSNSTPDAYSAVVMLHGCSGMWSNQNISAVNSNSHFALPGGPNLQNNVEKWGIKLAQSSIVALAVDSYTKRRTLPGHASADVVAWQSQCAADTPWNGTVDPYTERVFDLLAGYQYLDLLPEINSAKIASLGWSQGAQSAMLEAAVTTPGSSAAVRSPPTKFIRNVSIYPGCGFKLGFGSPVNSFWRPYRDMHLHVGKKDGFYTDCFNRATKSNTLGAPTVTFPTIYEEALHSFDNTGSTESPVVAAEVWQDSECAPWIPGDECAMRSTDIDALAFLQTVL